MNLLLLELICFIRILQATSELNDTHVKPCTRVRIHVSRTLFGTILALALGKHNASSTATVSVHQTVLLGLATLSYIQKTQRFFF
jgi:hypothetical protein